MKSKLNELFDSSVEFKKIEDNDDNIVYEFKIDNLIYHVNFIIGYKDEIDVEFGIKRVGSKRLDYKPTNDSTKPFLVYSTVLKIIKKEINDLKPQKFTMSGKIDHGLGKLYEKMINHLSNDISKIGYTVNKLSDTIDYKMWEFTKKENLNELFDTIIDYKLNKNTSHNYNYIFYDNEMTYIVEFDKFGKIWYMEYGIADDENHDTDKKSLEYEPPKENLNPFSTLSTVIRIIKDFIDMVKPDQLIFTGDTKNGLGILYTKMLKFLQKDLKKYGYSVVINSNNPDYKEWTLTKDKKKLNEKLIRTTGNYGNVIIMSGGSGAGKGRAIKMFLETGKYKVRDVDAWKLSFLKLSKIKDKYPEIRNLNLKNPDDVYKLHEFVNSKGIKSKTLDLLLSDNKQDRLPNIVFDITGKNIWEIVNLLPTLINAGYDPKKINLIWVLSDYKIAIERNKKRSRTVPEDILLKTHEGSAKTFLAIARGDFSELKQYLNGGIYVILNNDEHVIYWDDKKKVIKDFTYFQIKKPGNDIIPFSEFKDKLFDWIKKYAPEGIIS